jgi:predicted nucleic acid-binding protein
VATAKVFGQIRAQLEASGTILPDADLQIAATAIYHDLELVSGNLRHFSRISNLKLIKIFVRRTVNEVGYMVKGFRNLENR